MAVCLSSKKHQTPMLTPTTLIFFFLVTPYCVASDLTRLDCLNVSPSEFMSSLKKLSVVLEDVTSTLQFELNNVNGHEDFHVSSAMSTCLDLLDLSAEELTWSLSAIKNPQGKQNGTGNLSSDLRSWISATLVNTDTCLDELEDATNSNMKSIISTKIEKVNLLVHDLLNKVHSTTVNNKDEFTKQGQFPSWVEPRDQNLLLQETNFNEAHFDAVVAVDGSGNYTKIMDAVHVAPEYSMKRYVIFVKKGVYNEIVEIGKKKWNIMMIGEGMDLTIITGNLTKTENLTTFKTATFGVTGRGFLARNISFMNTAGAENNQSVALRSDSDLSVFYQCGIFGYQDSLYIHSLRQFYRECKIKGTVDFIFGHGTAVFQECQILVKKGKPRQKNTITAHGLKTPHDEPTGFSFQFCNISADVDLLPLVSSTETYLGRPWKTYSRVVFMESYMSNVVWPQGWLEWNGTQYLDTLYYAEFKNKGPGAGIQNRVKWAGYHVINDYTQVTNFTVSRMILGDLWLPSTGVTFNSGFVL